MRGNGSPLPIPDDAVQAMVKAGEKEMPNEACGVLLPDGTLVELPNRAEDPTKGYDLWVEDFQPYWQEGVVVWHTHPSGLIGPSRGDMTHRLEGVHYLVVTLDGVATLY